MLISQFCVLSSASIFVCVLRMQASLSKPFLAAFSSSTTIFRLACVAPAAVDAVPGGTSSSSSEGEQHRGPGASEAAAVTDMLVVLDDDSIAVAVPSKATGCCQDVSDVGAVSDAGTVC